MTAVGRRTPPGLSHSGTNLARDHDKLTAQCWEISLLAGCSTSPSSSSVWLSLAWWSPGQLCLLAGLDEAPGCSGPQKIFGNSENISWFRSTAFLRRPMRSLTHTAKCRRWLERPRYYWGSVRDSFRFIYSPECLGIMSRKRSSGGAARDIKVETSGFLFELEDSRDNEKWSVRHRLRRKKQKERNKILMKSLKVSEREFPR